MPDAVVEAEGLVLRYGARTVLDGLDLSVARGRVTGLIGPNGVGKSSLLAAAGGLVPYQSGSLRVAGREVSADVSAARRAARSVFWPDEANRALTGAAYLAFLRAHRQAAWRAGAAAALTDALSMAAHLARPVLTYSHGTKAKLSLIAALSFEAEAYLLDEALNGLDHRATAAMTAHLRGEASKGRAVVVASHALPMLHRLCDDVAVLTARAATVLPGAPAGGAEADIAAALDAAYGD